MSISPARRSRLRRIAAIFPAGRGWWPVVAALLAGLLLFALVVADKRDDRAPHGGIDGTPGVPGQAFEPLPAPLPAGDSTASGMDDQPAGDGQAPRIDGHADAPAPPSGMVDPSASPADATIATARDAAVPRLLSAPAPEYPRSALRAGASGNVVLRIEVQANGRPGAVSVVQSSRHRDLDRAAVQAVRRWRFQPALREGAPVAATVQQVISFDAPR